MDYRYSILIFLLSFFCFSCTSAPEETVEIIINNKEKTDSIGERTDSIDNKSENSTKSLLKLEQYFQLYNGYSVVEGAAIYGDYLFQASVGSELHIYNFAEKKYITTIKLYKVGHADTICFGAQKVDENDDFPVLYISGPKVYEEGKKGEIYVYRIERETDELGLENWKGTLCQIIKTPDVAVVGNYPDIVIDEKNKCLWMMGWFSQLGHNGDGGGCTNIFSKFPIPSITEGTKDNKGVFYLTLSEESRLSYFLVYDIHAITQGLCFYNGMIICPYGKPSVSYKGIDFVDVNKQQVFANVNLSGSIIYEAEAAFVVNDELYIVGQRDFVFKCSGLDISSLRVIE